MKRLVKSYNSVLAGVCGGISEYINPELDPLVIRLLWAVFSVFNPFLVLIYFILALIMPGPQMIHSKQDRG